MQKDETGGGLAPVPGYFTSQMLLMEDLSSSEEMPDFDIVEYGAYVRVGGWVGEWVGGWVDERSCGCTCERVSGRGGRGGGGLRMGSSARVR